jgi:hypothetical protein
MMASERLRARALRLSFGVLLFAGVLRADPTDDQKKTARNAMAEGRELRDEKNYKDALEAFKKAHAIMGVPTTGIEIARTMVLLGQLVEARDAALSVAHLPPQPKEPAPFQAARDEASKLADDLNTRIPTIKIVLTGADKGPAPEVRIDDVVVGAEALKSPIARNPGKHDISAKRGSDIKSTQIELKESTPQTVTLDFTPPKPATSESAAPPPPPPPPPPSSPWKSPLVLGGFGVAAVGVIAGGVTGFLAMSKASSAKSSCVNSECPPSTHSDIDSGKSMATISDIAFAVGIVGAGVGVYGLLTAGHKDAPPSDESARAEVTPWLGLGSAGVAGRF